MMDGLFLGSKYFIMFAIRFRHYGQCNTSVMVPFYIIGYCVHCNGQVWDNVKIGKSYS